MDISSSSSEGNFDTRSFPGRSNAHHPSGANLTGQASGNTTGSSSSNSKRKQRSQPHTPPTTTNAATGLQFDMLAWYPKHQSCQKYFVDHAQHDFLVQAFAAFINILLPFQRDVPVFTSRGARTAKERIAEISHHSHSHSHSNLHSKQATPPTGQLQDIESVSVSLIPYIRRLVCTGMDVPQIMHGFFGNDWQQGVGPQRETERRNYLFAAKSGGWAGVKRDYDMLPLETVPFLKPLMQPFDEELEMAEGTWSEWLAMEDWMVGSRAPGSQQER